MIRTYEVNRSQLKAKVGVIAGTEESDKYKNTVMSYIDGQIPVFIRTNLNQQQWDKFCEGKLSEKELLKAI